MKTYIKILLVASIIGIVFAGIFIKRLNNEINLLNENKDTVSIFQVGSFTYLENAKKLKETYPISGIIKEDDNYLVIIGVTITNKELLQNKFSNINYMIKELNVSNQIFEEINKYDLFLSKTSNESIDDINKKCIELITKNYPY